MVLDWICSLILKVEFSFLSNEIYYHCFSITNIICLKKTQTDPGPNIIPNLLAHLNRIVTTSSNRMAVITN